MKKYKTEQEIFWAGQFGDEYIKRNNNETLIASNIAMFSKILDGINYVESVIEFGANIGLNLIAVKSLLPKIELSTIEINQKAVLELQQLGEKINIYHKSILDFMPEYKRDFTINFIRQSKRYICNCRIL